MEYKANLPRFSYGGIQEVQIQALAVKLDNNFKYEVIYLFKNKTQTKNRFNLCRSSALILKL